MILLGGRAFGGTLGPKGRAFMSEISALKSRDMRDLSHSFSHSLSHTLSLSLFVKVQREEDQMQIRK